MKNIIVVSHRRSGTHLTIDSIINNFINFNASPKIRETNLDYIADCNEGKYEVSLASLSELAGTRNCIFKTHSTSDIESFFGTQSGQKIEFIEKLFLDSKVIYVYRDGRDVMTSLYHYVCSFSKAINKISFSEFLRQKNSFNPNGRKFVSRPLFWAMHVDGWLKKENVLAISYSEIKNNYIQTHQKISSFIDEEVNEPILDVRMERTENNNILKENKTSIKRTSVNFHKGREGEWKNLFSESDRVFYNQQIDLLANDMID